MKRNITKIILILALLIIPSGAILAAETKSGSSIYIATDEIVNGNLYAAGQTITIDGSVSGDVIAAAQTIKINGRVEGDIIAAAQEIIINGEVGGNIRVAGNSVLINGAVARNVNAFGSSISIGSNARVGWDVFLAGMTAEVRGVIDGGLNGSVEKILIAGKIGKNVDLKLTDKNLTDKIIISNEAVVNGDLTYTSTQAANISDGANLSGKVQQVVPKNENKDWLWLWKQTYSIFAALVVGLVLIFLTKNITGRILSSLEERPLKAFLPGLIFTLILPVIALVLVATIIGIPLALLVSGGWLMSVYLAKIITALALGRLVVRKFIKKDGPLFISLVLGIFICWFLFAIPYVGWIISLIATCFGVGGLWFYVSHQLKHI